MLPQKQWLRFPKQPRELMEFLPLIFSAHTLGGFEIQTFLSLTFQVQRHSWKDYRHAVCALLSSPRILLTNKPALQHSA